MLPVLQIGPLAIQVPGLVLLLGIWLGLSLSEKRAPQHGLNPNLLYNLIFLALIGGVIGARLVYVGRYPQAFLPSPLSILSLNPSLLDPWGAAAGALIAILAYGQRKHLPFWPTLDALTPFLAVMAVALALSNLASGSGFGSPTRLPWGIELWGATRHPAQVYETLVALVILAYLWFSAGVRRAAAPGVTFLTFLVLSSSALLFLEAFRGDSTLLPGGLRLAQVIAWLVLAAGLWALYRRRQASVQPLPDSRI